MGQSGDSSNIISNVHTTNLTLYNGNFSHTITTLAINPYSWIPPTSNPSTLSILTVNPSGILGYSMSDTNTQFLSSDLVWTEQCHIAGLNTTPAVTSFDMNIMGSGIVINNPALSNCLFTLKSIGPNYVLTTDILNNLVWEPRSDFANSSSAGSVTLINTNGGIQGGPITTIGTISLTDSTVIPGSYNLASIVVDQKGRVTNASSGVAVTSIETTNGILISNSSPATGLGPLSGTIFLGLDGWQINPSGKILEPTTTLGGSIGEANNIVKNVNAQNLILYNGANTHTLKTNANSSYGWTTPNGNPISLSLLSVDPTGIINYNTSTSLGQFLSSNLIWTDQCKIAGLNTSSTTSFSAVNSGSGIVVNNTNSGTCLTTLASKGANYVLVTDSLNNITWELRSNYANSSGAGTVTQVNSGVGLQGGPITTTGTISLTNTGVTPGTYSYATLTVDLQGRLTNVSNGAAPGGGTVTNIGTGTGLQGGPITSTGTIFSLKIPQLLQDHTL